MSGRPKRAASIAEPPIAKALNPARSINRADNASCASGIASGLSCASAARNELRANEVLRYDRLA
jgi:hypothetical protein